MGQPIEIWDADVVGDMLLVSTDRSFTGQDGERYSRGETLAEGASFPARLAEELFQADAAIDHVYLMSNVLSVRRGGGWDEAAIQVARDVVAAFFLFYEAQPTEP